MQKITKKFKIKCEICERWKNNEICRENDKKKINNTIVQKFIIKISSK